MALTINYPGLLIRLALFLFLACVYSFYSSVNWSCERLQVAIFVRHWGHSVHELLRVVNSIVRSTWPSKMTVESRCKPEHLPLSLKFKQRRGTKCESHLFNVVFESQFYLLFFFYFTKYHVMILSVFGKLNKNVQIKTRSTVKEIPKQRNTFKRVHRQKLLLKTPSIEPYHSLSNPKGQAVS